MKKLLLLGAAFAAAAIPALHAQTFTLSGAPAPLAPLFTLPQGHAIGAIEADAAGNLYYFDVAFAPGGFSPSSTRLLRRDSAGITLELFNFADHGFASAPFASFIRLRGSQLYFGESDTGTMWRGTLIGGTLASPAQFADIDGNYDFAFRGGDAFVSANPGGFSIDSHVYRLDLGFAGIITLSNGGATSEVNASAGGYSGPIAFDTNGNLLYGGEDFGGAGDIFRIIAADLDGPEVVLDNSRRIIVNQNNRAFAAVGETLYQTSSHSAGLPQALTLYRLDTLEALHLGAANGSIGALAAADGDVYTVVSQGFGDSTKSAVFVIPEPCSALLALSGLLSLAMHRRRA